MSASLKINLPRAQFAHEITTRTPTELPRARHARRSRTRAPVRLIAATACVRSGTLASFKMKILRAKCAHSTTTRTPMAVPRARNVLFSQERLPGQSISATVNATWACTDTYGIQRHGLVTCSQVLYLVGLHA